MAVSAGTKSRSNGDNHAGTLVGFAWPAALLGLAALSVPLLIHLLARGEFQRVAIATTRFVNAHPKRRWRRLKVSHPWLLALRMLLIALCVALVAEPFRWVTDAADRPQAWTFVSTQLDASQAQKLLNDPESARWLAPGFPSFALPRPQWQPGQLWSLLDAAHTMAPDGIPLDILVPSTVRHPGTQRSVPARDVRWIDAGAATFERASPQALRIDVVVDQGQEREADAVALAIAAWRDAGIDVVLQTLPAESANVSAPYVVWLSTRPWPQDLSEAHTVVARQPLFDTITVNTQFSHDGSITLREQYADNVSVRLLDTVITPDGLPDSQLARQLLSALLGPVLQTSDDYQVPLQQLARSSDQTGSSGLAPSRQPVTTVLMWLIALTAALERAASAWTMRASHDA